MTHHMIIAGLFVISIACFVVALVLFWLDKKVPKDNGDYL